MNPNQTPHFNVNLKRRSMLRSLAALTPAALYAPGLLAEYLETPASTEGPFYPDNMPLDTDNDLLRLNDSLTPAVGVITHLTGQVFNANGSPARHSVVEIWQADAGGAYIHSGTINKDKQDKNFQGFGRFLTDSQGRYYFRTIRPIQYPGRTAHIHFAVLQNEKRALTSQFYVKGHPGNTNDRLYNGTPNKERLLVDFAAIPDSPIGELAANFNIVLGETPAEA